MFLRARYMEPSVGRFLSRDVWEGDPNQPMSYNYWPYVFGNPVMNTDLSGRCPDQDGDGRCDPGWTCYRLESVQLTDLCLIAHCLEPELPWRRDPRYLIEIDAIPNWGVTDEDQTLRVEHARDVRNWMCQSGGAWGIRCPEPDWLTAWIFEHEQAELLRRALWDANQETIGIVLRLVVEYLYTDLSGPNRLNALARETSFFNPMRDSVFDQQDWDMLQSSPMDIWPAIRGYARVNPLFARGNKLIWWHPYETWPGGVQPDYTIFRDLQHRIVHQYFAVVTQ